VEKALTREEIESLLAEIVSGNLEPEKELAAGKNRVLVCDIFNTDQPVLVPNLDVIYDSFIRYNRVTLSNRLRKIVEIKKLGARPYKFDDFLQTLPSPVCMAIYKIEPLKGAALITMDSKLVFMLIDSILGGSGVPANTEEGRIFTSIELRLMEKIIKDVLVDMEKSWTHIHATKMNLLRMEMNPRLVTIVPPEYQVITMTLEIQVEEFVGTMMFAIPYTTIDPIRDKLKIGTQLDITAIDPQWSNRLATELMETTVEISVELGQTWITMNDLLNMAEGDTILLNKDCRSELKVSVEGVEKYAAVPGVQGGNKAIRIMSGF
jgi:flagellar motor switch protein FliM